MVKLLSLNVIVFVKAVKLLESKELDGCILGGNHSSFFSKCTLNMGLKVLPVVGMKWVRITFGYVGSQLVEV